ncbi:MAG: hypothetical protein QG625_4353 [Cyanobacteriota bacterium erpe_2018_sw_39hr_WHONDRS-SW48-000098_B_bin.30]|jgi:arsenate reductase|nr:arsenate reductase (glutaredoxin) [Candidatus Obscuribacter sp.]MDQ5968196.1 hypothetical protein [Cyanobacteriota bacterium erpe_2018_sw_39hr_WHONDRS-SW48-000098_B_bin.30]
MSEKITVYERPTCSKCREADKLLRSHDVDFEKVNYYIKPLTAKKLKELLGKMDLPARAILRTSEAIYKELKLAKAELSDDQLIKLMVEHPDLMQRPIVERGNKAVLGRPTENIEKLFE